MTAARTAPTADELELFREVAACPEYDAVLDLIATCNCGPVTRPLTPDAELALIRDLRARAAHVREHAEADEVEAKALPPVGPVGPGRVVALRPVFERMRRRLRQFIELLTPAAGTPVARRLAAEFRDPAAVGSLAQLGELIALARTVLALHDRSA